MQHCTTSQLPALSLSYLCNRTLRTWCWERPPVWSYFLCGLENAFFSLHLAYNQSHPVKTHSQSVHSPTKDKKLRQTLREATPYSAMTLFGSKSRPVPWLTDFIEKDSFTLSSRIWKTSSRTTWSKDSLTSQTLWGYCMCMCVCYLSSNNFDPHLLPDINNLRGFLDSSGWHLAHMYQTSTITGKNVKIAKRKKKKKVYRKKICSYEYSYFIQIYFTFPALDTLTSFHNCWRCKSCSSGFEFLVPNAAINFVNSAPPWWKWANDVQDELHQTLIFFLPP